MLNALVARTEYLVLITISKLCEQGFGLSYTVICWASADHYKMLLKYWYLLRVLGFSFLLITRGTHFLLFYKNISYSYSDVVISTQLGMFFGLDCLHYMDKHSILR